MASVRKILTTVQAVDDHGSGVFTITLTAGSRTPRFRAGQFLHLAMGHYEPSGYWPESRVFSIANSPTIRDRLRITYAVKGAFTARMARGIEIGRQIWVKLPYGSFSMPQESQCEMVLIAGGTGVSPFISFLEELCNQYSDTRVYLFYGARNKSLVLFRDVIEQCHQRLPGFNCQCFAEVDDSSESEILSGRLNVEHILNQIDDQFTATYYLSGPLVMIKDFRNTLRQTGVAPENIRVDDWE